MHYVILCILLLFVHTIAHAQTSPIRGKITEAETGVPVLGATIVVAGSSPVVAGQQVAVSDERGFFGLSANVGDTLRVTYVGKAPQLVVVRKATDFLNIALREAAVDDLNITIALAREQWQPIAADALTTLALQRDDNTSILPALNRVPGVFAHQGTRSTSRITIRGMGARSPYGTSRLRAYYGDIPLTDGEGGTTIEDLDLNQIQSARVLRGPVAGLYGSGLGGAVLLQPVVKSGSGGSATFSYGAFQTYRTAVSVHHRGLNVQASHVHSDGYRDNNQYDRYSGSLTGRWWADEGQTRLEILALVTDVRSQIPSSLNADDYQQRPAAAAPTWAAAQGYEDYTKGIFGATVARHYSKSIEHTTTLFANVFSQEEAAPFAVMLSQNFGLGLRTRLDGNGRFGRKPYTWQIGTEVYQEWRRYSEYDHLYPNQPPIGALQLDNQQRHGYANFFGEATLRPVRALQLLVGFNVQVAGRQLTDFYILDSLDVGGSYQPAPVFSPRVSLRYTLNDYLTVFGNYIHGVAVPTVSELQLPTGGLNTAIRPEQGHSVEVGAEAALFRLIHLEVTAYRLWVRDLLVAQRTAQNRYIGVNAGQTQHTGIEVDLSLEFRLRAGAFIHPFAQYSWSYHTFLDFEDRGQDYAGNRVTGVPPHVLTVGVDGRVPLVRGASTEDNDRLSLSGTLHGRWVAGMPLRDDNSVYSEAYFLLGGRLGIQYRPMPKSFLQVQLFVGVDNALNSAYASMLLINASSFGGQAPRYYYPGLPRNAYVGVQLDF